MQVFLYLLYNLFNTPGRRQSITLKLSKNVDQKIVRNRVVDCHLSPGWRQIAIENTVSHGFFYPRSSIVKSVVDCRLPGAIKWEYMEIDVIFHPRLVQQIVFTLEL